MIPMETSSARTSEYEIVEGFRPGYLGRIAQMHGEFYAEAWGTGAEFEAQTARELCDFYADYDADHDVLLTVHVGEKLIGSVAILGAEKERPGARLRWFLLEKEYQGRGIGSDLLRRALAFCREKDFPAIYLWTVEGLPQSLHLYERAGFTIVERFSDTRYTVEHTHLRLEMSLA